MLILLFLWYLRLKTEEKAIRQQVMRNFANNYHSVAEGNDSEKLTLSRTIENTIRNSQQLKQTMGGCVEIKRSRKKSVRIEEEEAEVITFQKHSPPCLVKLQVRKKWESQSEEGETGSELD